MSSLEEDNKLQLDFGKVCKVGAGGANVVPVAVQNIDTGEVILVAYVNEQALRASIKERRAIFWSTSRQELWEKGKTSGNGFELIEIYVNCEQNSLLYRVKPIAGGICHTKNAEDQPRNCFYRKIDMETGELENMDP